MDADPDRLAAAQLSTHCGDQPMTNADYSNLIVACKTFTMRSEGSWRDVLDELAKRLGELRDKQDHSNTQSPD